MNCKFLLAAFIFLQLTGYAQSNSNPKPNIVLIVADDLGWKDLGFMGSKFYHTPNLDVLAKKGMIFRQAYAGAANCAPSRACMLSGMNTPRHGIYTVGTSARGEAESRKIIPTVNNEILPDSLVTFAEVLKENGYYTGSIGKWHLGQDPKTQGFSYSFGGNMKGANKHFVPYQNKDIPNGPEGEYLTNRIGDEAVRFLNDHSKEPFFLYLPFFAVHTPMQAPDTLVAKYKGKGDSLQHHEVYAAMIEALDNNVGKVLSTLDKLKVSENTIIIFVSDNGGIRSISKQNPIRAGKGSYYEGGIRIPMVVRWPGVVKENTGTDEAVTNMDIYPTILEMLKLKNNNPRMDGTSLMPVFKGGSLEKRALFWYYPVYLQAYNPKEDDGRDPVFRTRPGVTVRDGDWKLHHFFEDDAYELYNLKTDLGEKKNLAKSNPKELNLLKKKLEDWEKFMGVVIPKMPNPKFKPEAQFRVSDKKSED